jgi:phosphoglucosamine mutase
MGRLFGTDGVRARANELLTPELALEMAVAAAHVLIADSEDSPAADRPRVVVGRDPRPSGEFLEAAVVAGLASSGVDVDLVGVIATPAVAHLVASRAADFGVVLSASHNPMPDNGIKLFGRGGHKLTEADEAAIEDRLLDPHRRRPTGAAVGRVRHCADAHDAYAEFLQAAGRGGVTERTLTGVRIVLDCANGAAAPTAPRVFRDRGADVVVIHAETDGTRINEDCGSTDLTSLRRTVRETKAHYGFAFDGDADRVLAVDAGGHDVDGDQILAVLALGMKRRGTLAGDRVVATVMSNFGLTVALRERAIAIVTSDVGDRQVLAAMRERGAVLGGEQSGHIVLGDLATTGDGILTALILADEVAASGSTLAELASVVRRLPQVLLNVSGVDKTTVTSDPDVLEAVTRAESELAGSGRVLLRASGTEPVVRIMVEAPTRDQADLLAGGLADVVRAVSR